MKSEKLIIEAQQICLEAAKEVLNFLEIAFTDMENAGCFLEEPTLAIKPYNTGYQIKIQAFADYRAIDSRTETKIPAFFNNIHIQPNTFFADYMKEGKNARLEYSHFFKGTSGYTSGGVDVATMSQFKKFAENWVAIIKLEIDSI